MLGPGRPRSRRWELMGPWMPQIENKGNCPITPKSKKTWKGVLFWMGSIFWTGAYIIQILAGVTERNAFWDEGIYICVYIYICMHTCIKIYCSKPRLDETNYLNFIMELGALAPKPNTEQLRMGHAMPMISIGRTLVQRGHEVIFAVSEGGRGFLVTTDCHWIAMIFKRPTLGWPLEFHVGDQDLDGHWVSVIFNRSKRESLQKMVLWNICKYVISCVNIFRKSFFATSCQTCMNRNHVTGKKVGQCCMFLVKGVRVGESSS